MRDLVIILCVAFPVIEAALKTRSISRLGQPSAAATALFEETTDKERAAPEASGGGGCDLHVLTDFFTTKIDWQRGKYVKPSFQYCKAFVDSAVRTGTNVTILYDALPENVTAKHTSPNIRFQQVDTTGKGRAEYGVTDVRFLLYEDLIRQRPDWKFIFATDISDVVIAKNPCLSLHPEKLYVEEEKDRDMPAPSDNLGSNRWMRKRFEELGGKYLEWLNTKGKDLPVLNAGVVGGSRAVMARLLAAMNQVISDPMSVVRRQHKMTKVDMAALNYAAYNTFGRDEIVSGPPVHSRYKKYELGRTDVWFIHK